LTRQGPNVNCVGQVAALEEEVAANRDITDRLSAKATAAESLEAQVATLQGDSISLTRALSLSDARARELVVAQSQVEEVGVQLKGDVDARTRELTETRQQLAEAGEQLVVRDARVATLSEQLDAQVAMVKGDGDARTREVAAAREKLAERDARVAELSEQLDAQVNFRSTSSTYPFYYYYTSMMHKLTDLCGS